MSTSPLQVMTPGPRHWPSLRDLVVRASGGSQCRDLEFAVADAPNPAQAWRERLAAMLGDGRLTLFARTGEVNQAFVCAYVDGEDEDRCVIIRHLVVIPDFREDDGSVFAGALLDRVEEWADVQRASEVLLEVPTDLVDMTDFLRSRGYRTTGVARPSFETTVDPSGGSALAVEWSLEIVHRRARPRRVRFAVAS